MLGLAILFGLGLWMLIIIGKQAVRWLGLKSIYLLLFTFLLSACQTEEEKRQAHFEELLSCKPETPLSKGELYERAMQDYWKQQMKWVWLEDEYLIEKQEEEGYGSSWLAPSVDKKIATKECGLTWTWLGKPDKITKDTCYPRKITQDHTFNDLSESANANKYENFYAFMRSHGAEYYHPESDPPLYTADYYNKPVDFYIINSVMGGGGEIYPRDCCTLMTYKEVKEFDEEHGEKWTDGIWVGGFDVRKLESVLEEDIFKKYRNEDYYFLMIKSLWLSTHERGYDIHYDYHMLSHCGQLITY